MTNSEAAVLVSVDGGLARITLNRPTRLNAFDGALAHAWAKATAEVVARDDVIAVLIDATGPQAEPLRQQLQQALGRLPFKTQVVLH